ncbi:hypothetical protein BCT07_13495 [Vibrio breoganii]|uniref:O-antigen ligase family protein n=1 Tax=Vibrio breoganii TaxID=553239 RepID=UPI000C82F718|nr:O-antigen ligase family protein [Vibrio breoganii]PMO57026.1 hypothetical protein BCT07_13495 [Vibrio breoganii]
MNIIVKNTPQNNRKSAVFCVSGYPKVIGLLSALSLLVIILTYRSFETKIVFYLSWLSGLFIILLYTLLTTFKMKLTLANAKCQCVVLLWAFCCILSCSTVMDLSIHLKTFVVATFYMFTSILISDLLIRGKFDFTKYTYNILLVWTVSNFILLVLFFMGVYEPIKHDFSGLFHDRNVFSITTLLVVGFAVSHKNDYKRIKISSAIMYLCLIICIAMIIISKSITGFIGVFLLLFLYSFYFHIRVRIVVYSFLFFVIVCVLITDNPLSARISRFAIAIFGDADSLNNNESAYLRLFLFKTGIKLFLENPFLGIGLDNAKLVAIWPHRGYGSFLHNTYLDIITGGGVLLFLAYYGPIFYCWGWLVKYRKIVKVSLGNRYYKLWKLSFVSLCLKLLYDLTWTTYFEYFMVFTVIFSMYIVFFLDMEIKRNKIIRDI